jgi:hypothetical protein
MTTTAARPVRRGALSPRPASISTRIPAARPARVIRSTSTFSSRPGESSSDRARCPRTTTCSRSSTSAPTVDAASNSAFVTPGRSSPLRVTSRVRASGSNCGAAGASVTGRDTLQRLPSVGVAPCDEVTDRSGVVVRPVEAHGEQAGAHVVQGLRGCRVVTDVLGQPSRRGRHARGPLDLVRVAPDPGAPLVEDAVLVGDRVGGAEAVPDRGVLGDDAQRLPLAATADENRDVPGRSRVQLRPARPDEGQVASRGRRAAPRRCRTRSRTRRSPVRTTRIRSRGSAGRR